MAYKLGNSYKAFIESATAGTYNPVAGQGSVDWSSKADVIDTTTKDDYPYKTKAPGSRDTDISLDIKPNLPDANGFTRLETSANAAPQVPFNFQIRKTPFGTTDVVEAALVYCTEFSKSFPQDGVVAVKASFVLAAPPTTDALT